MNGAVLLSLVLVLVQVALAYVPLGCVKIKNAHWWEWLIKSSDFDSERRHVAQGIPYQRWHIVKDGEFYWKIKLDTLDEELYESDKNNNGNYIFTWKPKTDKGSAAQWNFLRAEGGKFFIKNVKFNHCLMAKGGSWISAYPCNYNDEMFEWHIDQCG
ncbi:uncharacterized protein LOC120420294 [Culex pipiens pallens]|uniref:Putative 16.3 kDa salivary peptide n=1 Tax=Culex quinquefasciatus TaxID=7176 RepID=Q6TRX8_CULQU|nr:uncharacterized protein LOC120420294 [Culex pipiens pallens]AAR18459.1 putative 16.3 kDa salivary peptide [Culex quinquefasciatus]